MKTDFSINVQINIGVTPEVVALVSSIINRQPAAVAATPAVESADSPEPAKPAKRASKKNADPKPEPEAAPADSPEPEPETKDPEPEPETKKDLTEEDVRAAMDKTRRRIEGEDYKENTAGDLYKKYHKQLTATFKQISALLGSDKPSALPAEKREAFIRECDALQIEADGSISKPLPF